MDQNLDFKVNQEQLNKIDNNQQGAENDLKKGKNKSASQKQEDAAERAEAKRQSDLTKAIENVRLTLDTKPGITAQDEAFLADIKSNPSLVVNGYPDMRKNNEFKEWLLLRGHDILRGTSAARPTWEVE